MNLWVMVRGRHKTGETEAKSLHLQHSAAPVNGQKIADESDSDPQNDDVSDAEQDSATYEIPIWIRAEPRWISGVTEQTTSRDLIEALLVDEGILSPNHQATELIKRYVITEKWRQMERILESKTKIWKIWKAWGEAQSEVKLTLRMIESQHNETVKQDGCVAEEPIDEYDSDRCPGSAIVRRRRHRASKTTSAWITEAQTLHPRSQKATIEKLMKLILNQGETIQKQLAKLRDRELQISQLEDEKHKIREKEHGKNYLLETYLKGLHEAEDKDLTVENSDSGVPTEETYPSNDNSSPICDHADVIENVIVPCTVDRKKTSLLDYTDREADLLRDHEKVKEFGLQLSCQDDLSAKTDGDDAMDQQQVNEQIKILEKIYVLNKHLQKEEELLVRLNAKKVRIESENADLTEDEILTTLNRLNLEIEQRNREIELADRELELSEELLAKKATILDDLNGEMEKDEAFEDNQRQLLADYSDPENIYNISKIILKNSATGTNLRNLNSSADNNNKIDPKQFHVPQEELLLPPPVQFVTTVQVHEQPSTSSNNSSGSNNLKTCRSDYQRSSRSPFGDLQEADLINSINILQKSDFQVSNNQIQNMSSHRMLMDMKSLPSKKKISWESSASPVDHNRSDHSHPIDLTQIGTLV